MPDRGIRYRDILTRLLPLQKRFQKPVYLQWKPGIRINLERCLQLNGRLDGHMVQGHVDTTAICMDRQNQDGSWVFRFEFPESFRNLIIEKGSVAVNGISLTCFEVTENAFSVAIIPYTFENTNIRESGSRLTGKY